MNLLGKSKNENDNSFYELYWDDVFDTDGRKYDIVCCRLNNQAIFGIVYSADSQISPNYFNSFNGEYIPIKTPGYTTYGYKSNISSAYNKFNSSIKKGFIAFNFTRTGGHSDLNFLYWYESPFLQETTSILTPFLGIWDSSEFWENVNSIPAPKLPWQDDSSTTGGGNGKWDDDTTDPITLPSDSDLNTNTIGKTFFATTYKVSFTELKGIAEKLWSTDFLDWVKQYFSNPLEGIINLSMIPVSYSSDSYHSVIIGNYNTNRVGNIVQSQYKTVDCGYIDLPEKWGGAIDYKSRITLYLPFIGSHDLDVIEIIGGRLSVSYTVDLVTGACVAFVKVKRGDLESVLYQFTGNCAYSMPVTQNSYNSLLSSMLSASATVAVGVATGGASTPLMVGAGASVASDARPHVAHSGNLAGNAGYMGIKKPYVILSRPRQSLPQNFGKYIGYQSHITKRLGDCKGFTQVEYIHIDGISSATSEELQEIENYLKSGVIIA